MTGQDLKNSILQLAIQGKLVEQREEEGRAKELIEEIKAEKERLIKEKKIRKEKPLPEIREEEISFDIPESWEWVRVIEISDMYTGNSITKRVKEEKYTDLETGYEYIATKDVGFDYIIDYDNGVRIPFDEEKFRKSYKDSILMCIEGGSAGRKLGMLDRTVCFGNKLCSFNPIVIKPLFLYYYLQSPAFLQEFKGMLTGIIGGVGINKLKTIIVPLPPLEEQKRIVEKIEELMPYIDKYGEAHIKLEELNKNFPDDMQKSILQYAIQGKLVEQREEEGNAEELYKEIQKEKERLIKEGKIRRTKALAEIKEDEIPFDIPESWKWVRLGDIIHNWGQKKPDKIFDYIDVGSIDNINGLLNNNENLIDPSEAPSRARKIVKKGTVLYSTVRPYLLNICVVDKEFTHEPIASTAFAVLHPFKGVEEKFLFYILRSPMFVSYVNLLMIGVAYPAINDKNLLIAPIPLPPLEEQKRLIYMVENLLPSYNLLKKILAV